MKDKCVLITGSSKGIGLSITQKLLELGARVIGIARDHESIKIDNDNYIKYISDISDLIKFENSIKLIIKNHPDINVLISNAGNGEFGPLENFSVKQINDFITTNLTSHLIISKYLLSHFKKIKIGDIIFIGSGGKFARSQKRKSLLYCQVWVKRVITVIAQRSYRKQYTCLYYKSRNDKN